MHLQHEFPDRQAPYQELIGYETQMLGSQLNTVLSTG